MKEIIISWTRFKWSYRHRNSVCACVWKRKIACSLCVYMYVCVRLPGCPAINIWEWNFYSAPNLVFLTNVATNQTAGMTSEVYITTRRRPQVEALLFWSSRKEIIIKNNRTSQGRPTAHICDSLILATWLLFGLFFVFLALPLSQVCTTVMLLWW